MANDGSATKGSVEIPIKAASQSERRTQAAASIRPALPLSHERATAIAFLVGPEVSYPLFTLPMPSPIHLVQLTKTGTTRTDGLQVFGLL